MDLLGEDVMALCREAAPIHRSHMHIGLWEVNQAHPGEVGDGGEGYAGVNEDGNPTTLHPLELPLRVPEGQPAQCIKVKVSTLSQQPNVGIF